jgi:hypothetical protein
VCWFVVPFFRFAGSDFEDYGSADSQPKTVCQVACSPETRGFRSSISAATGICTTPVGVLTPSSKCTGEDRHSGVCTTSIDLSTRDFYAANERGASSAVTVDFSLKPTMIVLDGGADYTTTANSVAGLIGTDVIEDHALKKEYRFFARSVM